MVLLLTPTAGQVEHRGSCNISFVWKHSKTPFDLGYMHMSMIESLGANSTDLAARQCTCEPNLRTTPASASALHATSPK